MACARGQLRRAATLPRHQPVHRLLLLLTRPGSLRSGELPAALGDVAVYRQTGNRRIPYAHAAHWPRSLLVIGDAMCAFNPIYGQGITVAAMQAELLGKAIGEVHGVRSTRRLQRRLAAVTDLPWSIATSEDLRQPTSSGRQTAAQRLLTLWTDRMNRLAVGGDPACAAALTQVYHLVGAPNLLFSPRFHRRVPAGPDCAANQLTFLF